MSVSRRAFVRTLGVGGAGAMTLPAWVSARGLEAAAIAPTDAGVLAARRDDIIRLMSNENPNGPIPAAVRAITASMKECAYYPASLERRVTDKIAAVNGIPAARVMLGSGSNEVLRLAVQAFCSPSRHLVTAVPTFESPTQYAQTLGFPVREVPLDANLRLDLNAMLAEVRGAGLVFLCNPNNPTGHVYGAPVLRDFIKAVIAADPDVVILVDEAYHEFVDDPSYASAYTLTEEHHRVFVSRTFSKIYGLAGIRVGYALGAPTTLGRMERLRLPNGISTMAQVAAVASLEDPAQLRHEQELNRTARAFTTQWFERRGYTVIPSHANFVLVDVRRDTREFQRACLAQGVAVGRPFPPLMRHSRISIGTMDEMQRATTAFARVLG